MQRQYTCEQCGAVFTSGNPKNPNRYCSYACRGQAQRLRRKPPEQLARVSRPCACCGTAIWRHPTNFGTNPPYCSQACRSAHRRVAYTCDGCGKVGITYRSSAERRFCSNPCRLNWFSRVFRGEKSPQWKGGRLTYYGPNWRQQRAAALERDRYTCQRCGRDKERDGRNVSVHHIVAFRQFGVGRYLEANRLENLTCLCRSCHQQLERDGNVTNNDPSNLEVMTRGEHTRLHRPWRSTGVD